MEAQFGNNHLRKCFLDSRYAERRLGRAVAKKYIQVVGELCDIDSFELLKRLRPRRFHQLEPKTSNRFALDLTANVRLIVEPTNKPDQFKIVSIKDYHGR